MCSSCRSRYGWETGARAARAARETRTGLVTAVAPRAPGAPRGEGGDARHGPGRLMGSGPRRSTRAAGGEAADRGARPGPRELRRRKGGRSVTGRTGGWAAAPAAPLGRPVGRRRTVGWRPVHRGGAARGSLRGREGIRCGRGSAGVAPPRGLGARRGRETRRAARPEETKRPPAAERYAGSWCKRTPAWRIPNSLIPPISRGGGGDDPWTGRPSHTMDCLEFQGSSPLDSRLRGNDVTLGHHRRHSHDHRRHSRGSGNPYPPMSSAPKAKVRPA